MNRGEAGMQLLLHHHFIYGGATGHSTILFFTTALGCSSKHFSAINIEFDRREIYIHHQYVKQWLTMSVSEMNMYV